jgi:hypothetical protein
VPNTPSLSWNRVMLSATASTFPRRSRDGILRIRDGRSLQATRGSGFCHDWLMLGMITLGGGRLLKGVDPSDGAARTDNRTHVSRT